MKKMTFLFFVSFVAIFISVSLTSCGSRDNAVKDTDIEELGDTVPASEFAVIEDTIPATTARDSVVTPDIKLSDK